MSRTVTIYTNCLGRVTEKAVQIWVDEGETVWIPKKLIIKGTKREFKNGVTEYAFTVPYWFASKEGLTTVDGWGIPKYAVDIN